LEDDEHRASALGRGCVPDDADVVRSQQHGKFRDASLDVLRTCQVLLHGLVTPVGFSSDEELQELAVDEQAVASGLDVLQHAVVGERVSQLVAVGRDTLQRSITLVIRQ
jgi:hypothetical protein